MFVWELLQNGSLLAVYCLLVLVHTDWCLCLTCVDHIRFWEQMEQWLQRYRGWRSEPGGLLQMTGTLISSVKTSSALFTGSQSGVYWFKFPSWPSIKFPVARPSAVDEWTCSAVCSDGHSRCVWRCSRALNRMWSITYRTWPLIWSVCLWWFIRGAVAATVSVGDRGRVSPLRSWIRIWFGVNTFDLGRVSLIQYYVLFCWISRLCLLNYYEFGQKTIVCLILGIKRTSDSTVWLMTVHVSQTKHTEP